jgi:hypothetical protein
MGPVSQHYVPNSFMLVIGKKKKKTRLKKNKTKKWEWWGAGLKRLSFRGVILVERFLEANFKRTIPY